jgi:inhibitor of cysteine peptidase
MRALLLGSFLVIAAASCTTAAPSPTVEIELTAADSAEPVKAVVGQSLVVRLPANPSTGYDWSWDEAAAAGILVKQGVLTSGLSPQGVGGGVTQTWLFRTEKSGAGDLVLTYRRPWEKDTAPAQTVRWQIQVH